ncbi:glycosyltransferase [Brunnivagina elsteri]|uniref:Glycosyl transferase family 2 n=1 Tax=Brunnivagina elsteri CCALA 953 TaxID=987040 RepID=A0A2A2TQL1_9CYAN|nr:glycosyltransferase [Calothrix elsteri]PAX60732.1 glycosyl transferase family 2 [Calothrix elsteri CCALA 953]
MTLIELVLTSLSIIIWVILLVARGGFWQIEPVLETEEEKTDLPYLPKIIAIIPARNEADLLPATLTSLLSQDYPGKFEIFLVDDNSTDETGKTAIAIAEGLKKTTQLHVINGEALASGWSGKLWAMEQGIRQAAKLEPDYFLLTDADIFHDTNNLNRLVTKAVRENLDLASIMVRLRCESFWEKLLIPAFVFFFQKLYPFQWVNNPQKSTAAAAGGCILIRRQALERIGGIESVRQALIDDCALALKVKSGTPSFPIWLGLSSLTKSLRSYDSLGSIWDMVARTAFTQLNYSPFLLFGTLFGMFLVYLVSPLALILGLLMGNWFVAGLGLLGWLLMSLAYFPTVKFYLRYASGIKLGLSPFFAFSLPIIGFLYTLMTFDSALRHWQGKGGAWKGRVY